MDEGQKRGKISYTSTASDVSAANLVWITFDTAVDNEDIADVVDVMQKIEVLFTYLPVNSLVILSSQLPVGSTKILKSTCDSLWPDKNIGFAYIPENLRLEKAIEVFTKPDRIIIGLDDQQYKNQIIKLLQPFSDNLIWMSVLSAEMTKHAINAFLATSVTFINELATLCEVAGANARDVERGLKSEERIGARAYLRPGNAIAGGTLLRDINYLLQLGKQQKKSTFLLSALLESNQYHKQWSCRKLLDVLHDLKNKHIAILGLTYKTGTNTLRRSAAIEMCQWLYKKGCKISAYDPSIKQLPQEFTPFMCIAQSVKEAIQSADAVIISTAWPQFNELSADEFIAYLKQPFIIDPGGFIAKNVQHDQRIQYFSVGVPE